MFRWSAFVGYVLVGVAADLAYGFFLALTASHIPNSAAAVASFALWCALSSAFWHMAGN